mmetsp:Transcript_11292/g.22224  ORF Transcript_11292/g.22224 Transcript_11292/m.22224 type:complete len:269 (+) Transcript_11292:816-1622(+)
MKRTTLQVEHPQLDYGPGEFNAGRKRYPFHKNLESDRFMIGKHTYNEEQASRNHSNYSPTDGTFRTPRTDLSYGTDLDESHLLREKLRQREHEYNDLLKQLEKRKTSDSQELEFGSKPMRSGTDPFDSLYKPVNSPARARSQTPLKKYDSPQKPKQPFENLNRSFEANRPPDRAPNYSPNKIGASQSLELPRQTGVNVSPEPKLPGPKSSNIFELATHPAFSQPRFTKANPKLHVNDPITGFKSVATGATSPDKRRGMADYGNMMFNQ